MLSMIVWAGVLGAAGLTLLWWDLVDFVLDRLGPSPARPEDDTVTGKAG